MNVRLHSDDYGYLAAVDRRIDRLIDDGLLSSISVLSTMVSRMSLRTLAARARRNMGLQVALHVNFTEQRFFSALWGIFTHKISQKEAQYEIEMQLQILQKAGVKVTAIDSHQHVHALSPIAEAVHSVAQKHGITMIRSYRQVQRHTWIAQVKYYVLKLAAACSYLLCYGRFGLPISWHLPGDPIAVMSWEGENWDVTQKPADSLTVVTHPYLPFDSNLTYMKFFKKEVSST